MRGKKISWGLVPILAKGALIAAGLVVLGSLTTVDAVPSAGDAALGGVPARAALAGDHGPAAAWEPRRRGVGAAPVERDQILAAALLLSIRQDPRVITALMR